MPGASLLTQPLTFYYSFLNLLRAGLSLGPEVMPLRSHGLRHRADADILKSVAILTKGTFTQYLDALGLPWTKDQEVSLHYCLSRIAEICRQYPSEERGMPTVAPVHVRAKHSGNVWLYFDLVTEQMFRSQWQMLFPAFANMCDLEPEGCGLKLREKLGTPVKLAAFCEQYLLPHLALRDTAVWYVEMKRAGDADLSRLGYYFVAMFILSNIVRYEPESLFDASRSETAWFLERFLRTAERYFPQLVYVWLSDQEQVYFSRA